MKINFQFGKKKPDKKQLIIVSIVLTTIIGTLSQCTGIKQNSLWDLFDEIQRKVFPQTIFNELILQDPEKLDRRIRRDVDHALQEYEEWERSLPPRMTNKTILKEMENPKYSETPKIGCEGCHLL